MPPKYNPRAERDQLIEALRRLDANTVSNIYMHDPLINAALDYLDPDYTAIFIGSQSVRIALLNGCKLHLANIANLPVTT